MENFYDMTTVSKKTLEESKRIASQRDAYLAEHNKQLQESIQGEKDRQEAIAMSGARFSNGSAYIKNKNRVNALNEEINYTLNSTVVGMSEMVTEIVKGALLLDESELAKIYPEYESDIRNITKDFLKNGNLNESVNNATTLEIMEYLSKKLPSVREGKSLTEAQLAEYVAQEKPINVNRSINNLSDNVSKRVASLLEKEAKTNEKIEREINGEDVQELDRNADGSLSLEDFTQDDVIQAIRDGSIGEDDLKEAIENGELTEEELDEILEKAGDENYVVQQETGDEEPVETAPAEQEETEAPAEEPEADKESVEEEAPAEELPQAPANMVPKKQVQMLPDGTMNINIYESKKFVREIPKSGLFESLAVNEAMSQIKEGKEYNSDLCLAKAIVYVTITEAMDELGLMNVGKKEYDTIIKESGGNPEFVRLYEHKLEFLNEAKQHGNYKAGLRISAQTKARASRTGRTTDYRNYKNSSFASKLRTLGYGIRSNIRAPFHAGDEAQAVEFNAMYKKVREDSAAYKKEKAEKKAIREKGLNTYKRYSLAESVICNQEKPILNTANPDDIGERIRQKKLLKEQQILND